MATYTVFIKTGEDSTAGTDSNVFIQLAGTAGTSESLHLPPRDIFAFESGATDKYVLELPELGDLRRCCVGHDNSEGDSGWYVVDVVVIHNTSGKQWRFVFDQWLGLDESGKLYECIDL